MISVILPAYNEEQAVGATVNAFAGVLAGPNGSGPNGKGEAQPFEILVVDDASTDATAEEARKAGARVISHPQNQGYGRSLKDGILAARYDTIVICDADGTYPAEELPAMLSVYRRGFDMVVGARRKQDHREPLVKSMLRRVLQWLVEFTAGRRIPDVNSGFRVFSRPVVAPYFRHLSESFSFTTSLTLGLLLSHRLVAYVEVPYRARLGTTKVRLVRDALRTLQYISEAILIYNPIKLFLLLSAFVAMIGVGCLALGALTPWRAGLGLAVESLLAACLLAGLGFVADLLRMLLGSRG